jgi:thiamine-monophosphate kinase
MVTSVAKPLNEFNLIKTYFSPLCAAEKGAFGLTDDGAVIQLSPFQNNLVITTDTLVEGVHFLTENLPEDIAAKLLRVSLSDLAAMGATPAFYNLAISLSANLSVNWFKAFTESLEKDQLEFGITLIGGDTVATTGPLTLTISAIGFVKEGGALRRNSAKVGDDIWVSGFIGDGALGLKVAKNEIVNISNSNKQYLLSRYSRPYPRTLLGPMLVGNIHAAIDVSDGLIADLGHICQTSGVGADVNVDTIPMSAASKQLVAVQPQYIDLILGGGDDYELLFTANNTFADLSEDISIRSNVKLTKIGKIVEAKIIRILMPDGNEYPLDKTGYSHF